MTSAASAERFGLVRRYPYCTGCIVATLLLIAATWFLRQETGTLQLLLSERAKRGDEMLSTLVGGSTTRNELTAVREAARRIDDNLVIEGNLAENLWYFYKLEEQTKVRLPELHQLSSPTTDKSPLYRRIPYTLRVMGSFEQVASFLQGLETGPRLVKVTGFSFGRVEPGGASLTLDLSIELLGKK